jgi:hypothetical protein
LETVCTIELNMIWASPAITASIDGPPPCTAVNDVDAGARLKAISSHLYLMDGQRRREAPS